MFNLFKSFKSNAKRKPTQVHERSSDPLIVAATANLPQVDWDGRIR